MRPRLSVGALLVVSCLLVSSPARAQFYFVAYLGTNVTLPAAVDIDVPAADLVATFHDVRFDARPFASPQYYGGRLGWLWKQRRFGLEAEFIHLKMYAQTQREYATTGRLAGLSPGGTMRMDTLVQRYAMSHGLNYLVANGVIRRPLRERLAFIARAGAGVTLPHAESTVLGAIQEQYEYAGPGGHAAAGADWQIKGPWSVVGEYKVTYSRPGITLAAGTGRTTALTHHFAFGFGIGLSR